MAIKALSTGPNAIRAGNHIGQNKDNLVLFAILYLIEKKRIKELKN